MKDIIIAYPNKEVALRLRALLVGEGFRVSHICALVPARWALPVRKTPA